MSEKKSVKKAKAEVKAVSTKRGENMHEDKNVRALCDKVLSKATGLRLGLNKWGAVQVRNDKGPLFTFRTSGDCLITHPMFSGTGKKRERIFKCPGSHYDYLSIVPNDKVTFEMLMARVNDPKSSADHMAEVYKGRESETGLAMRAEAAKKRAGAVQEEGKKAKGKKGKEATAIKRTAIKRKTKAEKAAEKTVDVAVGQVAAEIAS